MFSPDEQQIIDWLAAKGFDQHGGAGLTISELQEELPNETPSGVLMLWREARVQVKMLKAPHVRASF